MFKIHPLTYLLVFIGLLSGRFKIIILFLLLIIVHELGHFLMAYLFNWKIDKIYIYPLGGLTKFNDKVNKPFIEELLITIMGPIFQVIITVLLKRIEYICYLSKLLLIFNLLPIVPLDGGRLLSIIMSLFNPFKKSINCVIKISYTMYIFLIIFSINLSSYFFILVIFLLIFKINEEKKNIGYIFNKFLLERYINKKRYKKSIIINKMIDMYKYKNNIIKRDNKMYSEEEYLSSYLEKKEL